MPDKPEARSRQEHIKIYDAPLRNIRIADSGNLLYGFEGIGETERVAVLDLTAYQKVFGKPQVLATRSRVLDSESGISQHIGELTRAGVLREALSQAQPGDSAMLAMTDSGAPALSILRRGSDDGSLVQKSLDPDGNMSMRTLMHLPEGLAKTADITMLRPQKQKAGLQNDSGHVRILLGVPPQDSYSFSSARNSSPKLPLPAVFERDASSITVVNIGTQPWIETSSHPHLLAENAESDKAATREVGVQIARKD
ncbi:hypothetical protein P171DRAFT_450463 [Karstenula rhodostoma CBS 690.94]|uniref:Uncharacterized protein n=1 Tax=Karstenula rhodostoma CBS 690.94 TaxID=1392251 RepID=A0A9P4PWA5_9PLEO|nr:hypothetical protein P171DRAFT_450463 [Karstenula rhodostoma CBS 690.94]